MNQSFRAARGGAAPESSRLEMRPVADFAARRVRAIPCAPSPTRMQVVGLRPEQAADAYTDVGDRAASGTSGRDKSRLALFRTALSLHQTAAYYKPAPAGQETAPGPDYNRYGRELCPKLPPVGNCGANCCLVKPDRLRRAGRCTGFVNEQNPCNSNPALMV